MKRTTSAVLASATVLIATASAAAQAPSSPAPAVPPDLPQAAGPAAGPQTVPAVQPAATSPQPALSKWTLTVYGLAEFNILRDSTQSFPDSGIGGTPVKRRDLAPDEARNGRLQFTSRNSRLGVRVAAPEYEGVRPSGVVEMDFFGVIPSGTSESTTISSGTLRLRIATVKIESKYVDVLAGQTYHLFGWMPFFYPCTVSFFPMPNMGFGRQPQLRVSRAFKTEPVQLDVGAAAVRPPQNNNGGVPDLQGSIKLGVNRWKGIHSLGAGAAIHDPLSIAVSGAFRHFRVSSLASGAPSSANSENGYGVSIDAFVPVIPASSVEIRGNALSLTGSFVTGTGIGDLGGFIGAQPPWPAPPNPSGMTPAPTYTPNIDSGLVTYDADGVLHTLDWRSYMVGIQYYVPPSGRLYLAANYTAGKSENVARYLAAADRNRVIEKAQYFDTSLFFDVTPAVRTAVLYGLYRQTYADDLVAKNHRVEFAAYLFF